ncbi:uncharacterized protein K02A2.6-like [Cydia splendana]|uniref:uncharacterized protein K02A2.6-like n=1 Tax=Cydia splendana TaxID=1100963 RepID=UPI00300CD8E9
MEECGVGRPLNQWFRDYLTARSFRVKVGSALSDEQVVRYGVPQGSGCGPLCYLMHVNSLCGVLRHCSAHMFADDLCTLRAGIDLEQTCRLVQEDVDAVVKWSHDNGIRRGHRITSGGACGWTPLQPVDPYHPPLAVLVGAHAEAAATTEVPVSSSSFVEPTEKQTKDFDVEEQAVSVVKKDRGYSYRSKENTEQRKQPERRNYGPRNMRDQSEEAGTSGYQRAQSTTRPPCHRCGFIHGFKCPAFNQVCKKCNKFGHYGKMCRNVKNVNVVDLSSDESDIVLGMVQINSIQRKEDYEAIQIHGHIIDFKLDTGADCNVLPLRYVKKLGLENKVEKNANNLYNYEGTELNCVGKIKLTGNFMNNRQVQLKFYVIDSVRPILPVLGKKSIFKEELMERKYLNCIKNDCNKFTENYKELFDDKIIGTLSGPDYKIKLKENAQGKVESCRKVPISLHESLKRELDKMEKLQVISKITEPTEFVSNIVIVKKPNGKIRVCLDPGNLNNCIMREHFKLPTFEEVSSRMAGAKVFSKLDASTAFFQIKLHEDSAKLCTFSTPFGRYYFKRLPYGLCSAPEVFHRRYKEIFENINGCEVFVDDLVVYGKDQAEHDERLLKVLQMAKENGVKFNSTKCVFGKSEIEYLGHLLTKDGIKPDPTKIDSIIKMEKPQNVKELQRLLGMIIYVAKFIPSLSQKYDIIVKYKPGKDLLIADALSRHNLKTNDNLLEQEIEAQVRMVNYTEENENGQSIANENNNSAIRTRTGRLIKKPSYLCDYQTD